VHADCDATTVETEVPIGLLFAGESSGACYSQVIIVTTLSG
jgi:hypothetical protein